jgi:serine/threonine protein kinase
MQVASTLAHIHAQGVVHRDVRPDNILFGRDQGELSGEPSVDTFLIDFGLAKATRPDDLLPISTGDEDILGTDEYMAPEQWESAKRVTGAADVYSLGVVLYRLASGRLPFTDPRRQVLMYQHLVTLPDPLPKSVPRAVAALIQAMLAKRCEDRPSAAACADLLRTLQ